MGGGLAGLSLALQLEQTIPDIQITVLEKREHPAPEAAHKVGESTVELAAHYFGEILNLKDHIKDRQLPKLGLRFFFPAGDNSRIEDRLELGGKRYAPCPSYQLDRGRFENHLTELCLERGINFVDRASVTGVEIGRQHVVSYEKDGETNSLKSRWLIDASGRRAILKRHLKMEKTSPHVANSAWFRFKKHIKIDDWSTDAAWGEGHEDETARFFSTNHLMGQGYWVWLIPLASGSTSMGIVAADEFHSLSDYNSLEKAIAWLEKHEPQAAQAVKDNVDNLQDFRAIKNYAVECEQVFSSQRWGITGEAGFFHDPFYSPGSDFIALSNTFLTDLIQREMAGGGIRIRSYSYDKIFKKFYYGTLSAYQNQYVLFGNSTVMPVKILWDYLVYWSITAFIFMHGRACKQRMYMWNTFRLIRLGKLNHFMQAFFRRWHEATKDKTATGYVNISKIPLIREMNQRLKDDMDDAAYYKTFADNLGQLQSLANDIVEYSGLNEKPPYGRSTREGVSPHAFENMFSAIKPLQEAESVV